jgi:hypothetical protein
MRPVKICALILFATPVYLSAWGQEAGVVAPVQHAAAPPAEPPIVAVSDQVTRGDLGAAAVTYSIGDPTPEEQLYLEFINRARANPPAEGLRLSQTTDPDILAIYSPPVEGGYGVNLALLVSQFEVIPAAPPLAFNEKLIQSARRHSEDMFQNVFQDHTGTDGSFFDTRISDAGYNYGRVGENIYAHAENVYYGHAGFEVDWGNGPTAIGGMQNPPGHRTTIHDSRLREVGVGVVLGLNGTAPSTVGPQVVTQDFGTQQNAKALITGVAYYDLNTNNFYDLGEGIGGITVTVEGQTTSAITARSGGYAIPVSGDGTYNVTLSAPGLTPKVSQVTVGSLQNQKIDFIPAYKAPVVAGPGAPATNANNIYTVSVVGGASTYQWRQFQKSLAPGEGAETGTSGVTIISTPGYSVIATDIKKSGTSSFHLAHKQGTDQRVSPEILTLNGTYLAAANSTMSFQSRLGWSFDSEHALVQVSVDDGVSWKTIYDQAGKNGSGESSFTLQTRSLAEFAGQTIRIRFVYDFSLGSYYSAASEVGWYIDDIGFSNTDVISNSVITESSTTSFQFSPQQIATYGLQARAKTGHDFLPWGPITFVQSAAAALEIGFSGITKLADGSFDLNFNVLAGTAPAAFKLQAKVSITDAWANRTATVETISSTQFRIHVPAAASGEKARFFRISN